MEHLKKEKAKIIRGGKLITSLPISRSSLPYGTSHHLGHNSGGAYRGVYLSRRGDVINEVTGEPFRAGDFCLGFVAKFPTVSLEVGHLKSSDVGPRNIASEGADVCSASFAAVTVTKGPGKKHRPLTAGRGSGHTSILVRKRQTLSQFLYIKLLQYRSTCAVSSSAIYLAQFPPIPFLWPFSDCRRRRLQPALPCSRGAPSR